MVTSATVDLPAPALAAASDGTSVWCLTGEMLTGYDSHGQPFVDVPAPDGAIDLAASRDMLVALVAASAVVWLDPRTGAEAGRQPVGPATSAVGGQGGAWVVGRTSGRAWMARPGGQLGPPIVVADVDAVAVDDGGRLWWTSKTDTFLRDGERSIDLGVEPDQRGDLAFCVGSVWLSTAGRLVRVGAWGGEVGQVSVPTGVADHLACGVSRLVGHSTLHGLFVLDPAVDADARLIDASLPSPVGHVVATRETAWVFPRDAAEAHIVALS